MASVAPPIHSRTPDRRTFKRDKAAGQRPSSVGCSSVCVESPEVAKARDATRKELKEAEQGWLTAIAKIAERAGLTKGPDGKWHDPSISGGSLNYGGTPGGQPLGGMSAFPSNADMLSVGSDVAV